jgi:hypothetical protein
MIWQVKQMDQASAHQALALSWQEFLIPIFQPFPLSHQGCDEKLDSDHR